MTTRYKTAGEKAGVQRRVAAYEDRLRKAGMSARKIWTNVAENTRLRAILAVWRGNKTMLSDQERQAAEFLNPIRAETEKKDGAKA